MRDYPLVGVTARDFSQQGDVLHDFLPHWMRDPISATLAQDLLEVFDDRFARLSTLVLSQVPVADWFIRFSRSHRGR